MVSKHSRIHLPSSFPVCASVDFVHQSSGTIIVYIHIRYILYTLKRQLSSTVIGKQKVNRFLGSSFDCIGCLTTVKALTLLMVEQNKKIAPVKWV